MKKLLVILVLGLLVLVSRANANLIKLENCFTKDYFYNEKTESEFKFKEVPLIINDPYVSESTIKFFKKLL